MSRFCNNGVADSKRLKSSSVNPRTLKRRNKSAEDEGSVVKSKSLTIKDAQYE